MNYFIDQKLKGNNSIDYTSFFILNNDKYIHASRPYLFAKENE